MGPLESSLPLRLTFTTYSLDEDGKRVVQLDGDLLPLSTDVVKKALVTAKFIHVHVPEHASWAGFPVWQSETEMDLVPQTAEQQALTFLVNSVQGGSLKASEVRPCLDSMFGDHVASKARDGGDDADIFASLRGIRLHCSPDVRPGGDVLAVGVAGAFKVSVHRVVTPDMPVHGVRFVTTDRGAPKKSHVISAVCNKRWLRPASHSNAQIDTLKPIVVPATPSPTLHVPASIVNTLRCMDFEGCHGNSFSLWIARPPCGGTISGYSMEAFRVMCASRELGNEWETLVDALHGHPVTGKVSRKKYGKHVTVASMGDWKMAQVCVGAAPVFPQVAAVVSMKVRRHRRDPAASHTWFIGKAVPLTSVHNLCYHVQMEDGRVTTHCMLSHRMLGSHFGSELSHLERAEDFGSLLQVYHGGKDVDSLYQIKAVLPEQTGAILLSD